MTLIQLAYSVQQAAAMCGLGETAIREALRTGELKKRYYRSKPLILHDDLVTWLETLPSEPSGANRAGAEEGSPTYG